MPLKPCSSYEIAFSAHLSYGSMISGLTVFALSLLCPLSLHSALDNVFLESLAVCLSWVVVFLALAGKWLRASGIARRGHVIRARDRYVRVWLHDLSYQCREASEGKETQPIP